MDVHSSARMLQKRKERFQMKKSVIAACFACMLMAGTAALAAGPHAGLLDFASRYADSYVPEDAQDYVQADVTRMENEQVTAEVSELYYDGYLVRMTVDVMPKDDTLMLMGFDLLPEDKWQNMKRIEGTADKADTRTCSDIYAQDGYQTACAVEAAIQPVGDSLTGGSADYHLNDDGSLTLYLQEEFETALPQREAALRLYLTPYETPLADGSLPLHQQRTMLETPLVLVQNKYPVQTYVSTETADFPSVGVRVEEVRIEVMAHEIRAAIDYSVTDEDIYEALDGGLWFEFIVPEKGNTTQPHTQLLSSGMSGGGSAGPIGVNLHRQSETLGRNELYDVYYLRAAAQWNKVRFETRAIPMKPAP